MPRHLALRIGLVVVVVLGSIWYLYPPKKSIKATVTFTPAAAGSFNQTLMIESNDPLHLTKTVAVTGTGK